MEREKIKSKLKEILFAVLKHNEFEMNDELTAGDVVGWDSLSHMCILTEIEEAFSFKFKLKEINKLKNLGSLLDIIEQKASA